MTGIELLLEEVRAILAPVSNTLEWVDYVAMLV